jgi:hypothetical protein
VIRQNEVVVRRLVVVQDHAVDPHHTRDDEVVADVVVVTANAPHQATHLHAVHVLMMTMMNVIDIISEPNDHIHDQNRVHALDHVLVRDPVTAHVRHAIDQEVDRKQVALSHDRDQDRDLDQNRHIRDTDVAQSPHLNLDQDLDQ